VSGENDGTGIEGLDDTVDTADAVDATNGAVDGAPTPPAPIELTEAALEALLFVAEKPLSRREIGSLAGADRATVDARLGDLEVSLRERGIRLLIDGDDLTPRLRRFCAHSRDRRLTCLGLVRTAGDEREGGEGDRDGRERRTHLPHHGARTTSFKCCVLRRDFLGQTGAQPRRGVSLRRATATNST